MYAVMTTATKSLAGEGVDRCASVAGPWVPAARMADVQAHPGEGFFFK